MGGNSSGADLPLGGSGGTSHFPLDVGLGARVIAESDKGTQNRT